MMARRTAAARAGRLGLAIALVAMAARPAPAAETTAATEATETTAAGEGEPIAFERWSPELFARARASGRFVLLDLGAGWCHWCHVMEATTYRDAEVARLVRARFIAVRADQDADPALARRYEDWGWPATIVFAPDGSEIVKRRGYLPPEVMASLLAAIIADPAPGPSVRPAPAWEPAPSAPGGHARLGAAARRALERTFVAAYDARFGGWGRVHKFVEAEPLELALATPRWQPMARRTLDAALALVDPVWGGMYQYSDSLDWASPHYEKIMSIQAQAIRAYADAYRRWHDPRHLAAARAIAGYLGSFLRAPDGAFYVSQDADLDARTPGRVYYALGDEARRRLGLPRVDRHVYARENGWAIAALAELYQVTREPLLLAEARAAWARIVRTHRLPDGAYRHDAGDGDAVALGDTLAMAEADVALAAADPEGPWAADALAAAGALDARFRAGDAGYLSTHARGPGALARPLRLVDENVAVARLALRLPVHAPPRATLLAHALAFLTSPTLPAARPFSPGVLRLDDELGTAGR